MEFVDLASRVAAFYLFDRKTLFAKFQKNNELRQVFLFLSKKYCRGRYPLIELAKKHSLTGSFYSSNTFKFQKLVNNNKELKDRVEILIKNISNVKHGNLPHLFMCNCLFYEKTESLPPPVFLFFFGYVNLNFGIRL